MRHSPPHLESFLLAEDDVKSVDLSSAMFRMHRAIAGSCTEYMHTDEELHRKAMLWANKCDFSSYRACPLRQKGAGTPRHYVMMCTETKPYTESICEAVETELSRLWCRERMITEGQTFHSKTSCRP